MSNLKIPVSDRTKVKSNAIRAVYDMQVIYNILDDTFLCHIGFVYEGDAFVIPTCFGRERNRIYFHGAKGSRMLKTIKADADICVSVSIVDGIVLARSAFNQTINYRSVMMLGKANELTDSTEKIHALKVITDHIIPGRWDDIRKPTPKELNATSVLSLTISEVSAKVRSGPPLDYEEDLNLKVWAGELPLLNIAGDPVRDISAEEITDTALEVPGYLKKGRNHHIGKIF